MRRVERGGRRTPGSFELCVPRLHCPRIRRAGGPPRMAKNRKMQRIGPKGAVAGAHIACDGFLESHRRRCG